MRDRSNQDRQRRAGRRRQLELIHLAGLQLRAASVGLIIRLGPVGLATQVLNADRHPLAVAMPPTPALALADRLRLDEVTVRALVLTSRRAAHRRDRRGQLGVAALRWGAETWLGPARWCAGCRRRS